MHWDCIAYDKQCIGIALLMISVASVTGVAKGSSMHSHTCLYNTDTSTKVIAHALHYPLPHKKGRL